MFINFQIFKLTCEIKVSFVVQTDSRYFLSLAINDNVKKKALRIYIKNKPIYVVAKAQNDKEHNLFKNRDIIKKLQQKISLVPYFYLDNSANTYGFTKEILQSSKGWDILKNPSYGYLGVDSKNTKSSNADVIGNYLLIGKIGNFYIEKGNIIENDKKLLFKDGNKQENLNLVSEKNLSKYSKYINDTDISDINDLIKYFEKIDGHNNIRSTSSFSNFFTYYNLSEADNFLDFYEGEEKVNKICDFIKEDHYGFLDFMLSGSLLIELNNLDYYEKKYDDMFQHIMPQSIYMLINLRLLRYIYLNKTFFLAQPEEALGITFGTMGEKFGAEICIFPRIQIEYVKFFLVFSKITVKGSSFEYVINLIKILIGNFFQLLYGFLHIQIGLVFKITNIISFVLYYNITYNCIGFAIRFNIFNSNEKLYTNIISNNYDNNIESDNLFF